MGGWVGHAVRQVANACWGVEVQPAPTHACLSNPMLALSAPYFAHQAVVVFGWPYQPGASARVRGKGLKTMLFACADLEVGDGRLTGDPVGCPCLPMQTICGTSQWPPSSSPSSPGRPWPRPAVSPGKQNTVPRCLKTSPARWGGFGSSEAGGGATCSAALRLSGAATARSPPHSPPASTLPAAGLSRLSDRLPACLPALPSRIITHHHYVTEDLGAATEDASSVGISWGNRKAYCQNQPDRAQQEYVAGRLGRAG